MDLPHRLRSFFRTTFDAPLAPEQPFCVIGDLHGSLAPLQRLCARLDRELAPEVPRIFVGDYIDRGEDSAAVLRHLHAGAENTAQICLRGNHEDMLLNFLDSPARAGPRWLRHGGLQTLSSFGLGYVAQTAPADAWEDLRAQLQTVMGPELLEWLRGLPLFWQSGNVAVTHAGADPATPLNAQTAQHLIWGHPDFTTTPRRDGHWVVHGHTIVDSPQVSAGRIAVDTGAYATGRLTAAIVTPEGARFLSS